MKPCEHHFVKLFGQFGAVGRITITACKNCMKSTGEIDVEAELAEANERATKSEKLATHYRESLEEIAQFDGWKSDLAKLALEGK